ncbi:FkbM family methyltransferase [Chamaesiphon polymorphus]|nr:FkbM family methyltransferase [Chamaesiphon polymorphus]
MIDYQKIIIDYNSSLSETRAALANEFVSPATQGKRYLFGRNETSQQVSQIIEIDGFIDDYAELGTTWQEKPVLSTQNVPNNAFIVNCVLCVRPRTAENRIKDFGFSKIIPYADLCQTLPEAFPLPSFVLETRRDLEQNIAKWNKLYERLSDDRSKSVLSDLLKFRLTANYQYLIDYQFRIWEQYFEPFMYRHSDEVFVDCGGFDGDTTEEFCKRYPDYKKVFLFEPSATNLAKARQRLQNFRNIEMIELGVSDREGILKFNPESGSASCVSDSGSSQISVTTLDKSINEKVTFIKMDLEGWELKALQGAIEHIAKDRPKLAIAVYHHPSDFWRISEFILDVRDDYDVYLRHYTEGWSETVMFFVPK